MSGIMSMLLGAVSSAITDVYFNLVTLLLPGNGTNGAQNNTFLDSSTNNFTITRNGNTTQGTFSPFSQTGWSNFFNGGSDRISNASAGVMDVGTNNFTIEMWFFPTSTADQMLFEGPSNIGFQFYIISGVLSFGHNGAVVNYTLPSSFYNSWHHLCVVREGTGSNQTSLYVDGVRQSQGTLSANITTTGFQISRTSVYLVFGYISNLRVVKGTAVYTGASLTVPTAPLTAISGTSLLTCQANRFVDSSSNAFALTVAGNTSVQAFSPFLPTAAYSAATVGGSGYSAATGDYLTIPYSTTNFDWFTSGTDYTIEAWIMVTGAGWQSGGQPSTIGNMTPASTTNYWSFGVNASLQPTFYYFNGSPVTVTFTGVTGKFNQWMHLAMCKTSSGIQLFANGVGGTVTAISGTPQSSTGTTLTIGQNNSVACPGYISGIRIVKGTALYSGSTYTIPTAPPTAVTNTKLLCNYTNAGITDATAKNDLETVGNAQISTTQSKFGGSSMSFDGTGDYLTSNPATTDLYAFGSGDFTIEMWLRLNSVTGTQVFYDQRPLAGGVYPTLYMSGSTLFYYTNGANRITGSNLSTNQWYHIAVSRLGTSTRLFVDGTQSGSTYTDTNVYLNAPLRPFIGGDGTNIGTGGVNGYIDDLRITRFARYTANFTAPTSAFALQ